MPVGAFIDAQQLCNLNISPTIDQIDMFFNTTLNHFNGNTLEIIGGQNPPDPLRSTGVIGLDGANLTSITNDGTIRATQTAPLILDPGAGGFTNNLFLLADGGTFGFQYIDGFVPQPGAQFTVLTAGQVIGQFDTLQGPGVFELIYGPGTVTPSIIVPSIPGDCDADGDVDLFDLATFHGCLTGPNGGRPGGQCPCADLDGDDDVDLIDFGAFQRSFG